jgi:hypothetical protein
MVVTAMVLIGDEACRGREELRLHEGRHVVEVEVEPQAPESPRGNIVRARAANSDMSYVLRVGRKPSAWSSE